MPIYDVEMPDGWKFQVDAPDMQQAVAALPSVHGPWENYAPARQEEGPWTAYKPQQGGANPGAAPAQPAAPAGAAPLAAGGLPPGWSVKVQ